MGQTGSNHEDNNLIIKLLIYIGGVTMGLTAKLATINRKGELTFKEILFQTAVAFACSFIVWAALYYTDKPNAAIIASVIVGRFGDSLLMAIGKGITQWITKTIGDIK